MSATQITFFIKSHIDWKANIDSNDTYIHKLPVNLDAAIQLS